jgi:hypothetical protein
MLGHASASVTLDVYADLFDEDLDTVAESLDRVAMQTSMPDLFTYAPRQPQTDIPLLPSAPVNVAGLSLRRDRRVHASRRSPLCDGRRGIDWSVDISHYSVPSGYEIRF